MRQLNSSRAVSFKAFLRRWIMQVWIHLHLHLASRDLVRWFFHQDSWNNIPWDSRNSTDGCHQWCLEWFPNCVLRLPYRFVTWVCSANKFHRLDSHIDSQVVQHIRIQCCIQSNLFPFFPRWSSFLRCVRNRLVLHSPSRMFKLLLIHVQRRGWPIRSFQSFFLSQMRGRTISYWTDRCRTMQLFLYQRFNQINRWI